MKWDILHQIKNKTVLLDDIVISLLANRNIVTKQDVEQFFNPSIPDVLKLADFSINEKEIEKVVERIQLAQKNKEKIVIYGDYDADGICSTAILWECLHAAGLDALPFIPDRFKEGYGINFEVVEKLKQDNANLGLVIAVDNGIVANDAIAKINKMGVDVVVIDHHATGENLPKANAIVHTTLTSAAGITWLVVRELEKIFTKTSTTNNLELAAIGIVADQIPLVGINRSLVKYGIEALKTTTRPGLTCLYRTASINAYEIGTYHINYIIAPRINAMGRIKHGIDSLRFLCTKDVNRAENLTRLIGDTNSERQKIVDQVLSDARKTLQGTTTDNVIVLANKDYHEGVIGLAAARIVEEFYQPTIIISVGETISKASARSISGFNMIETLRSLSGEWEQGGGHAMAAGFSIRTDKIDGFIKKINDLASDLLTPDTLEKKLKIDLLIDFDQLSWELANKLREFEPNGIGNPGVVFATNDVEVFDTKIIGGGKHLKVKFKKGKVFDAIFFGAADKVNLSVGQMVNIAYSLEINEWNGTKSLQLKIKDLQSTHGK